MKHSRLVGIANLLFSMIIIFAVSSTYGAVNINTAGIEELTTLPGIGPATAQKIINYRQEHGAFSSIEQLTDVPGIGEKTLEKLRELITAGEPAAEAEKKPEMEEKEEAEAEPYEPSMEEKEVLPMPTPEPQMTLEEVFQHFEGEPGIDEVHRAVLRYADIDPSRIRRWYRNSKNKALLPRFKFTLDRDTEMDRSYQRRTNISISSSTGNVVIGPDDITKREDTDDDWELQFQFTWDLDDFVFNSDMLRVANESEDLVELREDILEEVTKLYFDRKRILIDVIMNPGARLEVRIKNELKIEELTAALDGYTGGWFSQRIQKSAATVAAEAE